MGKLQHTTIKGGRIVTATYLKDRETRPRRTQGVDWGAERIVIVRLGNKELWWWRSHKSWAGLLLGYQHREARLCLADGSHGKYEDRRTIHKGGRMSRRLFEQHAKEINEWFGQEVAPFIDQKLTLIGIERRQAQG